MDSARRENMINLLREFYLSYVAQSHLRTFEIYFYIKILIKCKVLIFTRL